jgi:hypothetical protein
MVDQMTPKAASGGFQAGCLSWKYQSSKTVKEEPIPATAKLRAKQTSRLRQWLFTLGLGGISVSWRCEDPTDSGSLWRFSVFKGFP